MKPNWSAALTRRAEAIRVSIASKWVGRLGSMEDLLQDLLLVQAKAAASHIPDKGTIENLMYTACMNYCLGKYRTSKRKVKHFEIYKRKRQFVDYFDPSESDFISDLDKVDFTRVENEVIKDIIITRDRKKTAERLGMSFNAVKQLTYRLKKGKLSEHIPSESRLRDMCRSPGRKAPEQAT